jgi:hypothetical protein
LNYVLENKLENPYLQHDPYLKQPTTVTEVPSKEKRKGRRRTIF